MSSADAIEVLLDTAPIYESIGMDEDGDISEEDRAILLEFLWQRGRSALWHMDRVGGDAASVRFALRASDEYNDFREQRLARE